MRKQIVIFKLSAKDQSGIFAARKAPGRSYGATVRQRFGIIWAMRYRAESPLHRAMRGTERSDWSFEILEIVPKGQGAARVTQLIEEHKTSEPSGGYNTQNGRRRCISRPSRSRKSDAHAGSRNHKYRPDVSPATIQTVYHQERSYRKAAGILGISPTFVKRVVLGRRFKPNRYRLTIGV